MFKLSGVFCSALFLGACTPKGECDPGFQPGDDGNCYKPALVDEGEDPETGPFESTRAGCATEPSFGELSLPGFDAGTAERPAGSGVAVADYNGDGAQDIVVLGPSSPLIFWGEVDPVAGYSLRRDELPVTGGFESALPVDFDGDGDQDLLLGAGMPMMTAPARDEILRNESGIFAAVGEELGFADPTFTCASATLAAADWNGDGHLDVISTSYNWEMEYQSYPACEGSNRVLLGGSSGFGEDALKSFPKFARSGPTFVVTPIDIDADGNLDLLVNQDKYGVVAFGHGGEALDSVFPSSSLAGMGIGVSDWNADGLPDIFAPWFGRAGIYLSRSGDGGVLYYEGGQALGLPSWEEVSWAGGFQDVDSDGKEELVIANGSHNPGGDVGKPDLMPNFALEYDGEGWADRSLDWGLESSAGGAGNTHSWVATELNGDGVLDYVQANVTGEPLVHLSRGCTEGHYLEVKLRGDASLTAGARVAVTTAEGATLTRWALAGGTAYGSGLDHTRVHFGLGSTTDYVSVRVTWSDGAVSEEAGVALDTTLDIWY